MDKKLLESLNNLSYALAEIANALDSREEAKSAVATALQSGNFSKELNAISISISKVKDDTEKIIDNQNTLLKNQNTILGIVKEKSKSKPNSSIISKIIEKTTIQPSKNEPTIVQTSKEVAQPIVTPQERVVNQPTIVESAKSNESRPKDQPIIVESTKSNERPKDQLTIVESTKSKENKPKEKEKVDGFFSKINDDGKKIKDTVGTLLLIAGGIVAIGAAFKIIGGVDWKSVIALSISLPLIAFSFSKISQIKMSPGEILGMIAVTLGISTAIASSSWILSGTRPIGFFQAATAIMIAGVFSVISLGIGKVITGLKGVNLGTAISVSFIMPILLLAFSYSISKSSEFLSKVKPIGFFQGVTAIMIAGVFGAMSFGIGKIVQGLKGVNLGVALATSFIMPVILIALSWSIYKSSSLLSQVTPIGFFQAITAIMIAGVFVALSYGIGKILTGFKNINPASAALAAATIPILLIALSGSIMISSSLLAKVTPIGFFQAITAIMIAGVFVVLGYATKSLMKGISGVTYSDILKGSIIILALVSSITASSYIINSMDEVPISKIGNFTLISIAIIGTSIAFGFGLRLLSKISISEILKGGLAILAIATTIALSSMILSIGDYTKFPSLDWTMGVGASLLAFGLSAVGLGLISISGVGALALLAGAVATLGVAGLIIGVDEILSNGSYKKYPNMDWILGVGGSLMAFSTAVVMLGAINTVGGVAETLSLGLIDNPIDAGISAITKIAVTIPKIDSILSTGSYKSYPSLSWVSGVGTIMGIFSGAVVMLGGIGLLGGGIFKRGTEAIESIAQSIVNSSTILSSAKYEGGPTKKWAEGISTALGAFSPIYSILMKNSILSMFGAGVSVEKFAEAIRIISSGITDSANYFANTRSAFKDGPPVKWSEGVSKSLAAFSPIYQVLLDNTGIFKSGISPSQYRGAIMTIVHGITDAAEYFSKNKMSFENPPPTSWASGVGSAISAFSPVYDTLVEGSSWFGTNVSSSDMKSAIKSISEAIIESAKIFGKNVSSFDLSKVPNKEWGDSVSGAITAYSPIFKFLTENSGWFGSDISELNYSIKSISESIVASSLLLSLGKYQFSIPSNFMSNVSKNMKSYVEILDNVSDVDVDEINSPISIIGSINKISYLISKGIYTSSIPSEYISNLSKNINGYSNLINHLNNTDQDPEVIINLIKSLSKISTIISSGNYVSTIPEKYLSGINSNMQDLSILSKSIDNIDLDEDELIEIIKSISIVSKMISIGDYNSSIPNTYLKSLSSNISEYSNVIKLSNSVDLDSDSLIESIKSILLISKIVSSGSYSIYPKEIWMNGIISSINSLSRINNADIDLKRIVELSKSILMIDSIIGNGLYQKYPLNSWTSGVIQSLESFINLKFGEVDFEKIIHSSKAILQVDLILSKGSYKKYPLDSWIVGSTKSLIQFTNAILELNKFSIVDLIIGFKKMKTISSSIVDIDQSLSKGKYITYPNIDWISGVKESLIKSGMMSIDIDNNIPFISLISGLKKSLLISDSIFEISSKISKGKYEIYPNQQWSSSISKIVKQFSDIDLSGINFEKESLSNIASSILLIDSKFKSGQFNKFPTVQWVEGTILAIQKMQSIINMLSFDSVGGKISKFFGKDPLQSALSNINMLAISFDKLSTSIRSFTTSIGSIDAEKLSSIRSLSSNVILMSLMDSDQFSKMMDAMEKKSGVFSDILSSYNESKKTGSPTITTTKSSSRTEQESKEYKELGDRIDRMTSVLADIASVHGSKGIFKTHLASLQEDVSIGQSSRTK